MLCDNNNGDNLLVITNQQISSFYNEFTNINNKLIDELNRLELNVSSDWYITQNNFEIVNSWLNMESYNTIATNFEIYEGNFIKNMIKLGNIVKSLIVYYKSAGFIEMAEKLSNFDKIINRDIVNCESIYLTI